MPQPSLRMHISDLNISPAGSHVGLWLDRMLPEQLNEGERPPENNLHPHTALIKQVHTIAEPEEYELLFDRWKTILNKLGAEPREAHVRGRMVVGLGAESVLETAVTLHRTYGIPYIPGSALKGLAAAYAHQRLKDDTWHRPLYKDGKLVRGQAHKIMFGDTTSAGYVTFFDALYKPRSGYQGRSLWPDVITVHHPDYYQPKDGKPQPPADWDSPTPVSFVSATGSYLLALAGPKAWVDAAFDILALALDEIGVGGKTSSGYGRLTLDTLEEARQRLLPALHVKSAIAPQGAATEQPITSAVPTGFSQQVSKSTAGSLPNILGQWRALDPQVQAEAARIIIARAREIKVRDLEAKPWYKELLAKIEG
jgi:CRISPR-associated protein Cmr6